jgi:hypothetical protein
MGFFSGRLTFVRFKVAGRPPRHFSSEHLERLEARKIGTQRVVAADDIECGWTAGDHILDTRFDLAKNIVADTLRFDLRIDAQKFPGDLLRAYYQVELEGLSRGNPSGHPSARQRREARELALERLEKEAKDGRYLKRKCYPMLWDGLSNELLVGTTSAEAIDRLVPLFHATFDRGLEPLYAGRQAFVLAEARQQTRAVDDARPANFVPGSSASDVAWILDEASRDFLGNEFLLWLWFTLEHDGDTLTLADGSEATLMVARHLVLECPRGVTGRESISSDGPTRLPEVKRAVQAGKLPRKAGLTMVRHDSHYELTLAAETLAVSAARLPAPEGDEERARLEERVGQIRHFVETLDLIYDAFGKLRGSANWPKELARMQRWLRTTE